jgi:hypothetical protein
VQRVFLSYTFNSHPDYVSQLATLGKHVRRVIEAMGLRVVDGEDLGGAELDEAIQDRICECDALIALYTPQAHADGSVAQPAFVASEFQFARTRRKPTFLVLHAELDNRGLGARDEHVIFKPDDVLTVVMKVLQTLSVWKNKNGRAVQIKIAPDHLAERYGDDRNDRCEYELLLSGSPVPLPPMQTSIVPEPGAAFVYVPNFVEGAKVRVRLTVSGDEWKSQFVLPQMGGVALSKVGGRP